MLELVVFPAAVKGLSDTKDKIQQKNADMLQKLAEASVE